MAFQHCILRIAKKRGFGPHVIGNAKDVTYGGVNMKSMDNVPLIKKEEEAMNAAVRLLKSQFSVERVILFGSKARGDSSEHSDIDLLLITSYPIHWREEKAMVEALFDLGMKYDVIFSPLFASLEEWERGMFKEFPIYREIIEEGAIVP